MTTGPLSGIRVLDVGHVVAGPFAAVLLGDLGADVVKIEDPRSGDTLRTLSPKANGAPLWWKVAGRNKRSVALDLRDERGRALLRELAAHMDVMTENFRPGTLERWRLGPEELHARNPRLVILRISGYGQGPLGQGRPGYGRIGEAMSGTANLTGEAGGTPLHVGFSLGDTATGLMGALGVTAALQARERTGRGDVIDLALFESLHRMIEWQLPVADQLGLIVRRRGNRFPLGYAVAGSYEARDERWVTLSAATDRGVRRLLEAAGGDELANDPRFATPEARSEENRLEQIDEAIRAWVRGQDADDVVALFEGTDVASGYVYDAAMMLDDPIFAEREAVISVDDEDIGGSLRMPGVVPRFTERPGSVRWAGPRLGQHTAEVLTELLGTAPEELDRLVASGVIALDQGMTGDSGPQRDP